MTVSHTSSTSIVSPAASVVESGGASASIGVLTPCGHRQETPTPWSTCWIASHSASATEPCLVTEYAAWSASASSPAADAVIITWPRPRASIAGTTWRAT
jgi:hypothetical protein